VPSRKLTLTGNPPETSLQDAFIEATARAGDVTRPSKGRRPCWERGTSVTTSSTRAGPACSTDAACMRHLIHKQYLPNTRVFDENRYFQSGRSRPIFAIAKWLTAANICEDSEYRTDRRRARR